MDKEIELFRKNMQENINKQNFCWCCGRTGIFLTKHHTIPQRVKNIVLNITIPVCENCQLIIHKEDELIGILKKILLKK